MTRVAFAYMRLTPALVRNDSGGGPKLLAAGWGVEAVNRHPRGPLLLMREGLGADLRPKGAQPR